MSTRFHQQALEEVSESVKMETEADAAFKAECAALLRLVQESEELQDAGQSHGQAYTVAWSHEGFVLSLTSVGTEGGCCCTTGTDLPRYQWEITIEENGIWTVAGNNFSYDSECHWRDGSERERERLTSVATQLSVQWGKEREKYGSARSKDSVNSILHQAKLGAGKAVVHQQTPAERAAAMVAAAGAGKPGQPATMVREIEIDVKPAPAKNSFYEKARAEVASSSTSGPV